jgi:alpha-tubulin suppressor-like RCC1 family protein
MKGQVFACGSDKDGRLGLGTSENELVINPEIIIPLSEVGRVIMVSSGNEHSIAVTKEGRVYTWGAGRNFKLGTELNAED